MVGGERERGATGATGTSPRMRYLWRLRRKGGAVSRRRRRCLPALACVGAALCWLGCPALCFVSVCMGAVEGESVPQYFIFRCYSF
jgi:hypothetical protein